LESIQRASSSSHQVEALATSTSSAAANGAASPGRLTSRLRAAVTTARGDSDNAANPFSDAYSSDLGTGSPPSHRDAHPDPFQQQEAVRGLYRSTSGTRARGSMSHSTLFRSEEMSLIQLYIPAEVAQQTIAELGELGLIQFRDVSVSLLYLTVVLFSSLGVVDEYKADNFGSLVVIYISRQANTVDAPY